MISEEILDAKSAELYLYWRILGIRGWRKQNNKTTTPNAVGFRLRQGHHTGRGRKSTKASSKRGASPGEDGIDGGSINDHLLATTQALLTPAYHLPVGEKYP